MIPEDWDIAKIGDLANIGSGGTPSREITSYWNGNIPWVTTSQIDFNTITEVEQFITEDGLKNSAAKLLPAGTLLIALYGQGKTRGKVGVLGFEAATNQACASISLQRNISREFLLHFLTSRYDFIRNSSNSGGQENLNGQIVKDIPVALPSLKEQRAIATALSDVDALLAKLDQLITKKRDLKQATMQQLLTGQTRLPGFSGEWKEQQLGSVITHCFSGATPYRGHPEFYNGDIRWITSGELNYNVITDTKEKITKDAVIRTNLKILPKGTFLMAITGLEAEGTRGSCGIVGASSTTNQSCMAIFPADDLLTEYLFHYYVYRGKSLALQYCQGTKQQSYTAKLVKLLPIALPPTVYEQRAIATILSDMDAEITALESRRDKTRDLKQGMMQELLSGKIRLI